MENVISSIALMLLLNLSSNCNIIDYYEKDFVKCEYCDIEGEYTFTYISLFCFKVNEKSIEEYLNTGKGLYFELGGQMVDACAMTCDVSD